MFITVVSPRCTAGDHRIPYFTSIMATLLILVICLIGVGSGRQDFPTYTDHECIRECVDGASPRTCVYNFTLEYYYVLTKACYDCPYNYTDCFRPHCVAANGVSRAIMTVNRMMPGPAIHVCRNDMVVVNVLNKIEGSNGVTIHWHGVFQKGYQYHDGAHMITQCPITEQSMFQYRFNASNRGTHYWHAHSNFHRGDGIAGSLVVRESRDPSSSLYEHDLPEHTMLVQDWLNELTVAKFISFVHAGFSGNAPSLLINGRGAFKKFIDPSTNETIHTPYSVFRVEKDQRYRFRVISNGIVKCPIQISVDSHELVVIASDGVPFQPIVVSSFNIYPGERFDFVLDADKAIGNYWIRARGLMDCAVLSATQVAILRYKDATETPPTEPTDYESGDRMGKLLNPLNKRGTVDLTPVSWLNSTSADPNDLKQVPDKQFYLSMDFYPHDGYQYQNKDFYPLAAVRKKMYPPQINRISNVLPPSPLLAQYHDVPQDLFCGPQHNKSYCSKEFCQCIHVLNVDLDDTVEVVLIDEGAFVKSHPMHLHGHNFRVVAMEKVNDSVTEEEVKELDAKGLIDRKLDTPIAKDTVTVPDGGYTIIRFKADNPGFWLLHCHVAFHNVPGMAVVFKVGQLEQMPRPPKHFPRCGIWRYTEEEEEKEDKPGSGAVASQDVFLKIYIVVLMSFISFRRYT